MCNRYFYGQLLGVHNFELETGYFIRQRSMFNRLICGYDARELTTTNPDCAFATSPAALTVSSAMTPMATQATAAKRRRTRGTS